MASQVYNSALGGLMDGSIDLDNDDIRAALLMTNTSADTDNDAIDFVGDIGTLDECDGANYVRKALASESVNVDDTTDKAYFDATDVTWSSLGAGTRSNQGVLVFKFVTNDADSPVIAWVEFAAPINGDGNDFTVQWSSSGVISSSSA
jgi:hypothetical protein